MGTDREHEWFDNDDFWRELFPFMFPQSLFDRAPEEVEKVLALTKPQDTNVLDLCCGPGRCSVPLAQAGYSVTGVDRTVFFLEEARARAEDAGVDIEWVHEDMRDFVRAETFDLVLSMFTSFGYFDDKAEDTQVLKNIFLSLKPGGVFLVDVIGKERLAQIFQPTTCSVLADGTKLVQRHEVFDDWTRIRNEWILIRDGQARSFDFHHTVYSGQELKDRLEQAGFTDVQLYGNFDGSPYDLKAQRLIAVGRKPGH
jgi:SAM-dependent methyltransferase